MLKRLCVFGLCICISSISVFAQDRPASAEELFYFYPADEYDSITFTSTELPEDEEAYRFYRWMTQQVRQAQQKAFENVMKEDQNQTKTTLFTGSRYNTRAYATRSSFIEFEVPREYDAQQSQSMMEELRKEYENSSPVQALDREKQRMVVYGVFIRDRSIYQVYYHDDVQAALQTALADGVITETGEVRHGRAVYNLSREFGKVSVNYFIWATETGEMLMTDKLEDLDAMISTIYDGRASILSQREYVDAFGMIPDLGHSWSIHFNDFNDKYREKQLEYVTDERMKKRWAEVSNNTPLYSVSSRSLGDSYTATDIEVYESMELASKALERRKQQPARYRQMLAREDLPDSTRMNMEYQVFVAENTEYTQDGNALIGVMTYDREYVKQMKKRYEALSKMWKEHQEEEKKKKEGEGKKK